MYSWEEIKRVGNCLDYMEQVLGEQPESRNGEGSRFNCPWRAGSDSGAFAVKADGWYDHVAKEGGSIIDLCARARHGGDPFKAAEELGAWLKLKVSGAKVKKVKAGKKTSDPWTDSKIVYEYDYVDELGFLVFQVVRFDPKDFRQRRPDPDRPGAWINNLEGVERIPFQLPEVMEAIDNDKAIFIVEGEKDVLTLAGLNLVATCNAGGRGKGYEEMVKYLGGSKAIIIPDRDPDGGGLDHAKRMAAALHGVAKSVRILDLDHAGKDVTDWASARQAEGLALKSIRDELTGMASKVSPFKPEEAKPEPAKPSKSKASALDRAVSEYNERYAIVKLGGKCVVFEESINYRGEPDSNFMHPTDFRQFHAHRNIWIETDNGPRQVNSAVEWLKHSEARRFEGISFDPTGRRLPPGWLNLWRGLAVKPVKGDWSHFREHIEQVVCCGVSEYSEYMLNWMARIVQDPGGDRPGVCIVLRGDEGTGKGLVWHTFGKLFGPHYSYISRTSHLSGNFNSHLKNAVFVFADEAIFAGDRANHGALKSLITENVIRIEPKGLDSYEMPSFVNLAMSTNEEWAVPAEEGARRFCVFDVSRARKEDVEYFSAMVDQMSSGGLEAMLYDLLRRDIAGVNLRAFPRTAALLDQKLQGVSHSVKFWHECLARGEILIGRGGAETDAQPFNYLPTKVELYEGYRIRTAQMGNKHPVISNVFFKELRKMVEFDERRFGGDGDRRRAIRFPDLAASRKAFERFIGHDMIWDEETFTEQEELDI